MQNLGGQTKSIMLFSEMAYALKRMARRISDVNHIESNKQRYADLRCVA